MKYLNHNSEEFFIGHFQGHSFNKYNNIYTEMIKTNNITIPDDLTIISLKSNLLEEPGLFKQLQNNNINYINPLKNENIQQWKMKIKLEYIQKALNECTTIYALLLDSKDVAINKDLSNIINVFKTFNKRIVYNASKNNFPDIILDEVENREQLGEFKYLNAGCCIGYTQDLKEFYKYVCSLNLLNPFESEQYEIRIGFNQKQDIITFDSECKIFQTFCKSYVVEKNGDKIII